MLLTAWQQEADFDNFLAHPLPQRLGASARSADGLITAFSAGIPLTGNCTVGV